MKVMFSLAEPLKGPQRGCSGMCLAKGVKERVYSRAQSPVVKVKIALEMLLIFQQYKGEQQVLYKSWRAPDPCVEVNNYVAEALQLDSFPYRVMEKSVAEGREILQASDSFSFFFPLLVICLCLRHSIVFPPVLGHLSSPSSAAGSHQHSDSLNQLNTAPCRTKLSM